MITSSSISTRNGSTRMDGMLWYLRAAWPTQGWGTSDHVRQLTRGHRRLKRSVAEARYRHDLDSALYSRWREDVLDLWVPAIRFTSCDLRVLMDQPAEPIPSHDPPSR